MTPIEIILDHIMTRGYFVHSPEFWDEDFDAAIKDLIDSDYIFQATEESGLMNWSYTYYAKQ